MPSMPEKSKKLKANKNIFYVIYGIITSEKRNKYIRNFFHQFFSHSIDMSITRGCALTPNVCFEKSTTF